MSIISEMYPIPAEIKKKLHVFLGDRNVEETIKTGDNVMRLEGKWADRLDNERYIKEVSLRVLRK